MGFTRPELEACRNKTVPDVLGPHIKLLFVGINPGLWTVATQTHFAHPGNRFYPALYQAGIINTEVDRSSGLSKSDTDHLIAQGLGFTNIVARATAKASELSSQELRDGQEVLRDLVKKHQPSVVAIAGITAYRTAFSKPKATAGPQDEPLESAILWVVPNPSGLNAHETVDTLAAAYRQPAEQAGIALEVRP